MNLPTRLNMFKHLSVLVTGGSGSFGTAFCEYLTSRCRPKRVVVFSRDWVKQDLLRLKLGNPPWLRCFVGDVRDFDRLKRAFHDIDIVIHAAALKDIVSAEYNPREALLTNTLGTQNVIDAAIDCGVRKVLFISTDKVCHSVTSYGKSKALAESLIIQGNSYAGKGPTRFTCVRYGNVLESRGSVVEVFKRQRESGEVTVTDARCTRFWMTLQEAVELVIYALGSMGGGEIIVPKIPSMRIMDLAAALAPECAIRFTGIRLGEKLHEILVAPEEARCAYAHNGCFVIYSALQEWKGAARQGEPVADGFSFTSDGNDEWLTREQLLEMVK